MTCKFIIRYITLLY